MNKAILISLSALGLSVAGTAIAQNTTVYGNDGERISSLPRTAAEETVPTVRIRLRNGQTNTLFFKPDGVLRILVDRTQTSVGARYEVRGDKVCVMLPVRGTDCWPYDALAPQGSVFTVTSDRGQLITATYLRPGAILSTQAMLRSDDEVVHQQ